MIAAVAVVIFHIIVTAVTQFAPNYMELAKVLELVLTDD